MKKIILTAAIILGTIGITSAQTKVNFGISLEGNLTNVKLTKFEDAKNQFNPGAGIGGFVCIGFNEHFALQPGLHFNYTEAKIKSEGEKTRFKYVGVELPVYAVGQYKAGNGNIFLGIGPHVGYGLSADAKLEHLKDCDDNNKIELDHGYVGGGAIAGYEFNNGIFLQAGYQLSFDFSSGKNSANMKTQTISLGVGYKF